MKLNKIQALAAITLLGVSCTPAAKDQNITSTQLPDTITVMSFNIRNSYSDDGINCWPNRSQAVVDMFNKEKPVVVGMQEVCADQLSYLDTALANYRHLGVGRDDGIDQGEIMAIFYDTCRVALIGNGTFWLSQTPDTVSRGWDAACNRTCEWAQFELLPSGRQIVYFNTHLDHVGAIAREQSVKLLVDRIEKIAGDSSTYILSADFNTPASDSIFNPLKSIAYEARATSPITDNKATYNGWGLDKRDTIDLAIDHFFYQNATPIKFQSLTDDYGVPFISDHYPVAFTLVIE